MSLAGMLSGLAALLSLRLRISFSTSSKDAWLCLWMIDGVG